MAPSKTRKKKRRKRQNFWIRQFRLLRFYLVTGILVWIPLIVTVWITLWLFTRVGIVLEDLIRNVFGSIRQATRNISWLSFLQEIRYKTGMGFGSAVTVTTMIPLVNFIIIPVAVAGATAMQVEQFPLKLKAPTE